MIRSVTEIAIAVENLEQATADFACKLGLDAEEVVERPEPPLRARFVRFRVDDVSLVVMASTDGEGPIARFIERRGEGVYSVTVEVGDIESALARFDRTGLTLAIPDHVQVEEVDDGTLTRRLIAFTHPKALHGLLLEVQQVDRQARSE